MKRTHYSFEYKHGKLVSTGIITCTVIGEMATGEKVWGNVNSDGKQYLLQKRCECNSKPVYYFIQI